MPIYTVQIEASDDHGSVWQALHPAEVVRDDSPAAEVAEWVAANQNIAEGASGWRVRVWAGADADTCGEAVAEYMPRA